MNAPAATLSVLAGTRQACLRVTGRANFTSSIDFRAVLEALWQKGCQCFVLDLTDCQLMDSTFLGILAGFGLKLHAAKGGPTVELLNANARIRDLLETLGVIHLFRLTQGTLAQSGCGELAAIAPMERGHPSKDELRQACLDAHRALIEIAPQNAAKFKEVAAFLAEDLKQARKP